MEHPAYEKIAAIASTPEELAKTQEYVVSHLRQFLKNQDTVLICFRAQNPWDLGSIFREAVLALEGTPVLAGPDYRWKTLLRQAFSTHATVIIGPPLVILGLSKVARATGTPLNIHHVVTSGYPCADWAIEGIGKGLDCAPWGCFCPGIGPLVSGFSCGKSPGVHIRDDRYRVTVDAQDGEVGQIRLHSRLLPEIVLPLGDCGRIETAPCACGCDTPRLVDIAAPQRLGPELDELYQQLHSWTSILDCRLEKGEHGLEIELVVFPGEKLPKLPSCAKRIIRAWKPEQDEPFDWMVRSEELKENPKKPLTIL